ncbi:MAG: 4-hydroxy-tetrahydrodipicolinate reductase [Epulopiscium sp. Nele67-Bin005]|nr:MAG: 4-hydroxy-tetrahydrodipicolinate reductase [Epulopiscium sp. Nele67-Bin005]
MIKIIMHGCNGKVGQVISNLISDYPDLEIVAGVDPNLAAPNPYPVFQNIHDCFVEADVIIDFSIAHAVPSLLDFAKSRQLPVVVCTTGLNDEQILLVENTGNSIPVFFSANMSLGVNLLINLAKRATEILSDSSFDIEIVEKHHNNKIDAPSGTALAIADALQDTLDNEYSLCFDRSQIREARPKKEIGVHAIRGGTIVGDHDIIFAGNDEVLTLSHSASSKDVFAVGALKAAKFLAYKRPGVYNMAHLLNQ